MTNSIMHTNYDREQSLILSSLNFYWQEPEPDCGGGGEVSVQLDPAHRPEAPTRPQEKGLELGGLPARLPRSCPRGQEGRQDEGDITQE